MTNKYLVKIDYSCSEVEMGGRWFVMGAGVAPEVGIIDRKPFASGPLPSHGCTKHYDSQSCEADTMCNWQSIRQVLPFSEDEARRVNAQELACLVK